MAYTDILVYLSKIFRELTWKDQNEGKNWYTNDLDLFIIR